MPLRRLYRDISLLSVVQIANALIQLAVLPYLARVMGAQALGQYALCFAVLQYVILVAEYGFNLSAVKAAVSVRADREKLSRLFWTVMLCKLSLAAVAWVPIWFLVANTPEFQSLRSAMLCGLLYVIGIVFFPQWLLQGLGRMREIALSSLVGRLALLPMLYFWVTEPGDLALAVGLTGTSALLTAVTAFAMVFSSGTVGWHSPSGQSITSALRGGSYIFASSVATNFYTVFVVVFLGYFFGALEVARYTVADKLRQAVQILLTPVQQALFPRMSDLLDRDVSQAFSLLRKVLWVLLGYCVAGGLLMALAAEPLIRWIFGTGYEAAAPVLMVFAILPLVIAFSGLLGIQILTVVNRQKVVFYSLLFGSGICVVSIYPLTRLWGAVGAALAVVLSELIIALLLWRSVKRDFPEFSVLIRGVRGGQSAS